MTTVTKRARSQRIEVRTTPEDRALIDRAVLAADTDLTEFVTTNLRIAAQRVLADRDRFALDADSLDTWGADQPPPQPFTRRIAGSDGVAVTVRRVNSRYRPPRLLTPSDRVDGFECRSEEQTRWLHEHARSADATGTSKVLVVTEAERDEVVAYYAWCMASITVADAPPLRKGAGRYPQPIALLARLGVCLQHEGRGLGAGLLSDVISRTVQVGHDIGCRGLLVHAESQIARQFYLHLVPEFEPSPSDDLHLVLLMKDIRRTLA